MQASFSGTFYSNSLRDAINYAAGKNALFVCSAGNKAWNLEVTYNYPPNYRTSNMITVAATT